MGVCVESYCVYGYCVTIDDFKNMIDLENYDTLWDWIEDYNRYEWCKLDEYDECVYFGIEVGYGTNSTELPSKWNAFKHAVENDINFNSVEEEGPHFHVFGIWDC